LRLLVLPGDGIGPEIVAAALAVLARADAVFGLGLEIDREEIGLARLARDGTTLPEAVLAKAKASAGTILGPV
jgi:isocitrate/isopropylmalate dehydrogenase